MSMSRNLLAAAALLLGLAAAPAFAQTVPAALPAPDQARTLEQNQRAYVAPRPAAPQAAPAKERPVATTLPPVTSRRVELADRTR
jgi:hypothetical protein